MHTRGRKKIVEAFAIEPNTTFDVYGFIAIVKNAIMLIRLCAGLVGLVYILGFLWFFDPNLGLVSNAEPLLGALSLGFGCLIRDRMLEKRWTRGVILVLLFGGVAISSYETGQLYHQGTERIWDLVVARIIAIILMFLLGARVYFKRLRE